MPSNHEVTCLGQSEEGSGGCEGPRDDPMGWKGHAVQRSQFVLSPRMWKGQQEPCHAESE